MIIYPKRAQLHATFLLLAVSASLCNPYENPLSVASATISFTTADIHQRITRFAHDWSFSPSLLPEYVVECQQLDLSFSQYTDTDTHSAVWYTVRFVLALRARIGGWVSESAGSIGSIRWARSLGKKGGFVMVWATVGEMQEET